MTTQKVAIIVCLLPHVAIYNGSVSGYIMGQMRVGFPETFNILSYGNLNLGGSDTISTQAG